MSKHTGNPAAGTINQQKHILSTQISTHRKSAKLHGKNPRNLPDFRRDVDDGQSGVAEAGGCCSSTHQMLGDSNGRCDIIPSLQPDTRRSTEAQASILTFKII